MNKKPWAEKWTIIKDLPGGGQCFNHLVKSKNSEDDQAYVLKRLKDNKTNERRRRFYREVHLTLSLTHPCLPRIQDHNCDDIDNEERLYFVYKYIDGTPLSDFVLQNEINIHSAILFMRTFLYTLKYCHHNSVIHRDIKPDNIIVRNDVIEDPVIIDFGLGVELDESDNAESENKQLGNRFLRLPELTVSNGDKRDIRSDITLSVAILFFIVTGEYPHVLIDGDGKMPHQSESIIKTLDSIPQPQRDRLKTIFDIGFQNNINDRIQTLEELQRRIENIEAPKGEELNINYEAIIESSTKASQLDFSKKLTEVVPLFNRFFSQLQSKLNTHAEKIKITRQGPQLLVDQGRIFSANILYHKFNNELQRWFQANLHFDGAEFSLKVSAHSANKKRELLKDVKLKTIKRFSNPEVLVEEETIEEVYQFMINEYALLIKNYN